MALKAFFGFRLILGDQNPSAWSRGDQWSSSTSSYLVFNQESLVEPQNVFGKKITRVRNICESELFRRLRDVRNIHRNGFNRSKLVLRSFRLLGFEKSVLSKSAQYRILSSKNRLIRQTEAITAWKQSILSSKHPKFAILRRSFQALKIHQESSSVSNNAKIERLRAKFDQKTIQKCFFFLKKKVVLAQIFDYYKEAKSLTTYKQDLLLKHTCLMAWRAQRLQKIENRKFKKSANFHQSKLLSKSFRSILNYKHLKRLSVMRICSLERLFLFQKARTLKLLKWKKWHSLLILVNKRKFYLKEMGFGLLHCNRMANRLEKVARKKRFFGAWKNYCFERRVELPLQYFCDNQIAKGFLKLKVSSKISIFCKFFLVKK